MINNRQYIKEGGWRERQSVPMPILDGSILSRICRKGLLFSGRRLRWNTCTTDESSSRFKLNKRTFGREKSHLILAITSAAFDLWLSSQAILPPYSVRHAASGSLAAWQSSHTHMILVRLREPINPLNGYSLVDVGKTISMSLDHTRDPCPYVTVSDFGGAFCIFP